MKSSNSNKNLPHNTWLRHIAIACFWLVVWQLLFFIYNKDFILPSPLQTAKTLGLLLGQVTFYQACGITLLRVVIGLLLSFGCGVLLALLSYQNTFIRTVFSGMVTTLKSMPVMSVILFAILFIVSGMVPIFVCFLMCFPVIYTNLLQGLDSTPLEYLELANVYKFSTKTKIEFILLPWAKPYLKAGLAICAGLSWKTVVAAEVLASPKISMGYHLLLSKTYFEADELFAWTIAIIVLSLIFENCVKRALK